MRTRFSAMKWFALLFVITVIMVFTVPATPTALHTLHVDQHSYHLLTASLLVPYGLIWFAGFYAYDSLDRYTGALGRAKEAEGFKKIATGVRVLAWGLILSAILSLLLSGIQIWNHNFVAAQTIVNHYVALGISLVALTFIADGADRLARRVNARRTVLQMRLIVAFSALIGTIFTWLVLRNSRVSDNPYYLSLFPLLLTIVVPYIYAWVIGFIGTYELKMYAGHVKGVLYRQGVSYLANGLMVVILVSIIAQFVTSAFARNSQIALGWVLFILYSLLAVEAIGFVLVAMGAKKLRKIEEV